MDRLNNQHGSAVLIFVTFMIVLLLIMVGVGLDTGHLGYIRSQGQPAVDASALSAATGIPTGNINTVYDRAASYNSANNYLNSPNNSIPSSTGTNPDKSITLVSYDASSGNITTSGVTIGTANGVRVALEQKNPHTSATTDRQMKSPLFLTPLFNMFGSTVANTAGVSVSAVAIIKAQPDLPIAAAQNMCGTQNVDKTYNPQAVKLLQSSNKSDTSGYTTFYINNASATEVKGLLDGALNCTGAPSVDVGFCTQLNNGQITSLYDEFEQVFLDGKSSNRCYFIPIVTTGVTFNSCSNILDFAKFCPLQCVECNGSTKAKDQTFGTDKAASGGERWVYGNMTCGQTPSRSTFARCQVPVLVRDTKSGM